jgi:flagellar hook protein FlgE
VNTVGYKRNYTDFQTIVTGSASAGAYSAGGVTAQSSQRVSGQGQLQRTSSATDLGIDGQGFFVATDKAENLTGADPRMYTRAGAFTLDKFGYLQNSAGLYLQGWPVDAQGNIPFDPSDLTRLQAINVSAVGGAVEQTTRASVSANLMSSQPLSAEAPAYDAATNSMAAYDPVTGAGVRPDFEFQIPISDSKGGRPQFRRFFLKRADPRHRAARHPAGGAEPVVRGDPRRPRKRGRDGRRLGERSDQDRHRRLHPGRPAGYRQHHAVRLARTTLRSTSPARRPPPSGRAR